MKKDNPALLQSYTVTVVQLVQDFELDSDDLNDDPTGDYVYKARNEDHALDQLHESVPIAVLEHYEVTAKRTEAIHA